MDRTIRLVVTLLLIAMVIWRLSRYMRFGVSRSRTALGAAGGLVPLAPQVTAAGESSTPPAPSSALARMAGILVAVAIWLAANVVIWFALFDLPILKRVPPIPLGIVGIFANFYLIPFAQSMGARCGRSIAKGDARRV
jgi:hypothetical protein